MPQPWPAVSPDQTNDMDAGSAGLTREMSKPPATLRSAADLIGAGLLPDAKKAAIERVAAIYAMGVTGAVAELIDPADPRSTVIADIQLAPRNARGKVAYAMDIFILKPIDPARGNQRLFVDINNRGTMRWDILNSGFNVNNPSRAADAYEHNGPNAQRSPAKPLNGIHQERVYPVSLEGNLLAYFLRHPLPCFARPQLSANVLRSLPLPHRFKHRGFNLLCLAK